MELLEDTQPIEKTIQSSDSRSDFSSLEKFLIGTAIAFGILGFIILIAAFIFFNNKEVYNSNLKIDDEKFGNFGSFISGAVGVVWSLVSVLLFYLTLRLQRKELVFQREELELTRKELQGQKEQMIQQNSTLIHQRFETTFFQLLNIHSEIVNAMDLRKSGDTTQVVAIGRDCFGTFLYRLKVTIGQETKKSGRKYFESTEDEILNGYIRFFEANQNDLGHYFRHLYHIIKFVDQSEIEDKKRYTNFVRAQLSSDELVVLFYNCLSEYGSEKFKPLIEKYSLLKNMNKSMVLSQEHLLLYDKKAYGLP